MATRIAPGVLQIDTLLGGWEQVTAGYLVEGPDPVLVETGSQSSAPALLAALADLGVDAADVLGGPARPPLRAPRPGARRTAPRPRRRRGGSHRPRPHADDRRLARPRQAPPGPARLRVGHPLRR